MECGGPFAGEQHGPSKSSQTRTCSKSVASAALKQAHRADKGERFAASKSLSAHGQRFPVCPVCFCGRLPASTGGTSHDEGLNAGAGHEPKVAVLTLEKLSKSNREFYLKYGILKYGVRGYIRSSRSHGRRLPIGGLPFERRQKRTNASGPSRPRQKNRHSDT